MPSIVLNWTSVRRDWKYQLDRLGLTQQQVAEHLGISDQVMTKLVKTMTVQQGLGANNTDKERWQRAIEFVESKEA